MTVSESTLDLSAALARFGLQTFRRGQKEVIEHVISGSDCLCVMPTGGGKSLCYQLPSLVRPGLTIVVSPLIALMKDQVDGLEKRGMSATLINSSLSIQEQSERLDQVASGRFSMVYVAPERLRNPRFLEAIRATPIQLLAIDEAHCISEWGHDFRPDYQRLGKFREALGNVQTIALTATATPRVRTDILESLHLKGARTFITGFARDNLYFGSVFCMSDRDKDKHLHQFLDGRDESGIIYVATRKRCESLVEQLGKELKLSVGAYHAGLLPEQRKLIQDKFMAGEIKSIVATNAFGMGIDKSDLRYVIHYNMPGTLEAYYQEAGRAGRDGLLSQCVLLFSPQDRYIQEFFIENANPSKELLQDVYELLLAREEDPIELTADEIKENLKRSATAESVNSALQILGRTGVLERLEVAGGLAMFRLSSRMSTFIDLLPRDATARRHVLRTVEKAIGDRRDEAVYIHPRWLMEQLQMDRDQMARHLRELCKLNDFEYVPPFRGRAIHFRRKDVHFNDLKIDHSTLEARKKADYEKLDQMVAFARTKACRQKTILLYFGDSAACDCKICDRCQGRSGWPRLPKQPQKPKALQPSIQSIPPSEAVEVPWPTLPESSSSVSSTPVTPPPKMTAIPSSDAAESKRSPGNRNQDAMEVPEATLLKPASRKKGTKLSPLVVTPELTRKSVKTLQTVLSAIERTHGYLSKTVLAQHFGGTASKAVTGLRLERLAEFGLLAPWKKTNASQLIDKMLDTGLLSQVELKLGKQTIAITDLGKQCIANADQVPESLIQFVAGAWHSSDSPDGEIELDPNAAKRRATSWTASASSDATLSPQTQLSDTRSEDQLPITKSTDANEHGTDQSILSDWQWTVRLVRHGYRLGECALIRGKTPDGILADLTIALQMGERVPIDQLLDSRTLLSIRELSNTPDLPDKPPAMLLVFGGLWDFVVEWLRANRKS